jgi:hypothetical protein
VPCTAVSRPEGEDGEVDGLVTPVRMPPGN